MTVEPPEVRITEAVTRGVTYSTASERPLPNLGEVHLSGVTKRDIHLISFATQCICQSNHVNPGRENGI